jgi:8-oxo-dGTP pyrophosphatase MutT (NUDIX family)
MAATWMEEIRRLLDREWPERDRILTEPDAQTPPREAAVLVPLYVKDRELTTLFTVRTHDVEHHKGQISFPGGAREPGDESLWHAAVREAHEEIGVPAESVRLLGALPRIVTVTNFDVSPYVGAIPYPIALQPHEREVASILEVPIAYLLRPECEETRTVKWKGKDVPTRVFHYQGHAIWGATAHILGDLLLALG